MSVPMSLLALLDDRPRYGLELKQEFERQTGEMWPLNVGQVYTTLGRLERDGLVTGADPAPDGDERQRPYRITEAGRQSLRTWFDTPASGLPSRDELVLKILLAAARPGTDATDVIQSERRAALTLLQEYTRLKSDQPEAGDLGWLLLLDSLIFKVEGRIRWLDSAESRLARLESEPETTVARDRTSAAEHEGLTTTERSKT